MEELFHLDHLATRMRRNAESLLVMAGTGAGSPWADAASAVDVVRAASAGVEDYRRLRLRHFDHAVIAAAATGDVVHILAELMENALSFSPPHATWSCTDVPCPRLHDQRGGQRDRHGPRGARFG